MNGTLQHLSLQWLLHLVAGSLAILTGPWPWLRGLLLLGYLAAQYGAARLLSADVCRRQVGRPTITAALAHAPGLLLAGILLLAFVGVLPTPRLLMVYLQWWTAPWTPLLARIPPVGRRDAYVWVTLALPALEWLAMVAWVRRKRGRAVTDAPA